MRTFLVLISLFWVSKANAYTFPVFGWVKENFLYVPSHKNTHGEIPEKLFAYGGGKEFIATLRGKDFFIAAPPPRNRGCDYGGATGKFVYDVTPVEGTVTVIIFDNKKKIQEKGDGNVFVDLDTKTEWRHFRLTSSEGGHEVWRVSVNGKCVAHIDDYMYCDYATERDDDKAFKVAMCGAKIRIGSTGF